MANEEGAEVLKTGGRRGASEGVYFNGHDTTVIISCGGKLRILFCAVLVVLSLCAACQTACPDCNRGASTPGARLTHGPLAGAVTASSANIWVRTDQAAQVQIQFGPDAALENAQTSAAQETSAASDFTTIVKIPNLSAQQTYFYTVLVNKVSQLSAPYPHFQTFAPPGADAPLRFVILSDFRTVSKITQNVDTFQHAAQENAAFVILGGDFDHRNPTTLDEKREMFRDLYTPANGMENFVKLILPNFSLIHFWDDHDYGDNNADKTYPEKNDSLRVLQEYFPVYPLSQYGDWQRFSYADADFFVLDSRSQRDPTHDKDSAQKSMLDGDNLGEQGQRAWLLNGLKTSTAKWKFIVSPVIFNPTTKTNDAWGAYPTERRMILDFIRTNAIAGVIVLSGDLHIGAIDDGTNSGLPELVASTVNDGFDKRCLTEPSGNIGKWSVGNYGDANGSPCNGYAVVSVTPENVVLQVKDSQGETRLSYTVK